MGCSQAEHAEVLAIVRLESAANAICDTLNVDEIGVSNAVLTWSVAQLSALRAETLLAEQTVAGIAWGTNNFFMLSCGSLVFIMQIGFAMFVAGVVRAKNMSSILLKSLLDTFVTAICFYLIGYGFVMGNQEPTNGFIGYGDFALSATTVDGPEHNWQLWYWNWVFCAASTTIMAGAIAERATVISYIMFAVFYSSWVYPVVAHWHWSPNGWLSPSNSNPVLGTGCIDFAGSSVVHVNGAFAALMAAIILGPRTGRFDQGTNVMAFKGGHTPSLYLLGTFLLWLGWYGFNPGSNLQTTGFSNGSITSRTAVCTTLACASSGFATMLLVYWNTKMWEMLPMCMGAIGGLVAITAGCSVVEPWAAIIIGVLSAPSVVYGEMLMEKFKIDDPAVAWACHGISGFWGAIAVGLLAKEQYLTEVYGLEPGSNKMGLFYGGHGQLLLCQFISVVITMGWSSLNCYIFFWVVNKLGVLRVSLSTEALGLDHAAMGEGNTASLLSNDGPSARGGTAGGYHTRAPDQVSISLLGATMVNNNVSLAQIPEDDFDFEKLKHPLPDGLNK